MNDNWGAMARRRGHDRVEFLLQVWSSAKGWLPNLRIRRRNRARELAEAKRADAEWALQFDRENRDLEKEELIEKLKDELSTRQSMAAGATGQSQEQSQESITAMGPPPR